VANERASSSAWILPLRLRTDFAQLAAFATHQLFDVLSERRIDEYLEPRVCYVAIEESA
jgi:hypothetical protein